MNLTETLFKVKLTEDIQFAKCGTKLVKNTTKKKMQVGGSMSLLGESKRKSPTLVTNTVPTKDKIKSVEKNTDVRTIQKYNSDMYNPQGNLKNVNANLNDSVTIPKVKYKANSARLNSTK